MNAAVNNHVPLVFGTWDGEAPISFLTPNRSNVNIYTPDRLPKTASGSMTALSVEGETTINIARWKQEAWESLPSDLVFVFTVAHFHAMINRKKSPAESRSQPSQTSHRKISLLLINSNWKSQRPISFKRPINIKVLLSSSRLTKVANWLRIFYCRRLIFFHFVARFLLFCSIIKCT